MALNRSGNKTALLVVDVQVGVMRSAWDSARVIENVQKTVVKARQSEVPVVWIQHSSDDELVYGSADWQWVPELVPADGEVQIHKLFNSSFEETHLDETLQKMGISHIILAGAASNWCIRSTSYAALDRGYDLTLISDAHTTESIEFDNGKVLEAEDIVLELNTAIQWLEYPNRKNQAISTDKITF